jgi:hypothetical protein
MIEELMATLFGEKPENDIFRVSYAYAARDFEDLLKYRSESYNPGTIFASLKKERRRLQKVRKLQSILRTCDRAFHTSAEKKLVFREFIRAEDKLHRFALIRDLGADAHLMKQRDRSRRWGEKMLIKYKDEYPAYFESQDDFIRVIRNVTQIDDDEPFLWLHAYMREFIKICPKSYLEKGTFGKFMRSIFGVLYYSLSVENVDYHDTPRLSGYFATTYLFDDILDDPGYSIEEKKQYYKNVLSILKSRTQDEITFSKDPVMAFSEYALVGMRELLDERRGSMISQSYLAIAEATSLGSSWNFQTPLTERDLYAIATIKAAYTRIIPAVLAGYPTSSGFLSHCMRAGLIYQLNDDLRDIHDDLLEGNITPYTYYRYGASKMGVHPIELHLAAVSRISEEYFRDIPDAMALWIMRVSHSLRVLHLKYGKENLMNIFREMHFTDDRVTRELAMIGECSGVIIDIEAEAARTHSDIAVNMRGGWSKGPVYGH